MKDTLLVFIKNVEKGNVKTRLAATVGDDKALQIYEALLGHTRQIAEQFEGNRYVFYSNFIEKEDAWSEDYFEKWKQQGADLGIRMQYAFEQAFEESGKVVIIGSDCASLTIDIVNEAFAALDHKDFVLGPALDGGYYLLGMRSFEPLVFDEIEWSTDKVLSATVKQIEELGKTYRLLLPLSDIDFEEDWEKWGWEL